MPAYDNEGATISMEDVRSPELRISTIEDDLHEKRLQLRPQKSTISSRKKQAVCVRRAYKKYGTKKNPNVILDGLNMTVPKGAIYGLLGASGCGKTTLLSCIVGRRRLNAGEIWVLGGRPGSPGSGVPGPRIGYMPQEVALFGEFSIRETMIYFGWIAGLSTRDAEQRIDFMVSLLQLPSKNKQVKKLSGGQQRRVSLAAALLHDPELLILDEPTVGVDPVLRQSIWDHLVEITRGGRTTVIITTHYIDETKQANIIGLMRGGKFLAEESPQELIRRYQAESLEDVFLKLSVLQNRGKRRRSSILRSVVDKVELPSIADPAGNETDGSEFGEISGEFGDNVSISGRGVVMKPDPRAPADELPPEEKPPQGCLERIKPMKLQNMKALIWKNFLSLFRNYGIIAFIIGLPLTQMIFFCLAIGHYPKGLPIAVINNELTAHNLTKCPPNWEPVAKGTDCKDPDTLEWNITLLSCSYLQFLGTRQTNLVPYPNKELAMKEAYEGKARAVLVVPWNFTESLVLKMTEPRRLDQYELESADIKAHLDNTDKQIEWMLMADMQLTLMDTLEHLAYLCGLPRRIMSSPVHFDEPVYGFKDPNFTDFAGPGVLLTIIFFLAVALTSGSMLAERNSGILERSLVSGITGTEILFSHVIVQMLVMLAQSVVVLFIYFVVFQLTILGPVVWVIILTLITGLCGMTFGFVVSCLCDTERTATYLALGSFLPMVMLCGIIWPIEGMHVVLQWVSFILPLTKSTESLRSMLQRGWNITQPVVYYGFVSTSLWITVYLITSILLIKFKKG